MYDLVIIGASPEGLSAAQRGIRQSNLSRIALITQGWETVWAEVEFGKNFGNQSAFIEIESAEILRQLASLGVDVITASGHFKQTDAGLIWQVEERELTSHAYLLTTDVKTAQAAQESSITGDHLPKLKQQNQAEKKHWGIWGALPQNLILAQTLAQQGNSVQLFTRNEYLLPGEDREMSHLLQCYLESMGIKIWPNCRRFTPHFNADSQIYKLSISVPSGSQEIMVDALWRSNLPDLQWHWLKNLPDLLGENSAKTNYLAVNDYLQTSHPQIFACGGWLKGYGSEAIAIQEAHFVVDRVLENTHKTLNYAQIPFGIDVNPPWYRIGLNQQEAMRKLEKIHLYYGYETYQSDSSLRGLCKIITNEQDEILGAHWFGQSAKPGIFLLTLATAEALTVADLQNLPVVDVGVAQVLQDLSRR